MQLAPSPKSEPETVTAFLDRLNQHLAKAQAAMAADQQRQAANYNKNYREHEFKVGDKVWIDTTHLRRLPDFGTRKLDPRCVGPFAIRKMPNPLTVHLKLSVPMRRRQNCFHVSKLRAHVDADARFPERATTIRPPAITSGKDGEWFAIRNVLDVRGTGAKTGYLVEYEGYGKAHTNWVPKDSLTLMAENAFWEPYNREKKDASARRKPTGRGKGKAKQPAAAAEPTPAPPAVTTRTGRTVRPKKALGRQALQNNNKTHISASARYYSSYLCCYQSRAAQRQ